MTPSVSRRAELPETVKKRVFFEKNVFFSLFFVFSSFFREKSDPKQGQNGSEPWKSWDFREILGFPGIFREILGFPGISWDFREIPG